MDGAGNGYHKKNGRRGREGSNLPPPAYWINIIITYWLCINQLFDQEIREVNYFPPHAH